MMTRREGTHLPRIFLESDKPWQTENHLETLLLYAIPSFVQLARAPSTALWISGHG